MCFTSKIADAARDYVAAAEADKSQRSEGSKLAAAEALVRLNRLVVGEKNGWDESHFKEN